MRPLLYHIIACCAVLFFTACDKEYDIPGGNATGDGNSIILDLSSGSLPISRAVNTEATGAEVRVSHIDVLIFDENGSKKHHERIGGSDTGNGTIVLSAKRSDFEVNAGYEVYLIANSTADVSVFAADDFDMTKLRQLEQTDRDIHMTGCPEAENVPQAFLMDGMAHLDGSTATEVILNDGNMSNDTKLKATLRRAAAKLVIKINKGQFVEFDNSISGAGYYLRNSPYSTSVLTGVNAEAALRTTVMTSNDYFKWTQDTEDGPYTLITVTAYAYAHSWDNASSLEKETRLIVNIPMSTILHNEQGDYVDESGAVVDDPVKVPHENNYYQIPVCEGTALERNTCYEVSLALNVPGGTDPSEPVELGPIDYSVREWDEQTIDIGGETDRPEYLTLNEEEFEMHNIDKDYTTLQFSSSSEVKAEITKVYYINKFGQEQTLEKRYPDNPDSDVWGVKTTTSSGWWPWEEETTTWSNLCKIRITPDKGISGSIDVFSDVPENNAVRYIEFTVTNETGQSRSVTVAQYPLTYITNVEGHYSYRDDFKSEASDGTSGVTTWLLLAGKSINKGTEYASAQVPYDDRDAWRCACSWENNSWSYTKNGSNDQFFGSKVAQDFNTTSGLSSIRYANWTERREGRWIYSYTYNTTTAFIGLNNHRMYHVQITASSGEYTLGRPRLDENGYTDDGPDNAELVSPSFMLASQLGAVLAIDAREGAAQHCKHYVEVTRDGTVYDDWRLPTEAEINIIYKFQNDSEVMDEVLSGNRYWSASGLVPKPGVWNPRDQAIRCIRDAYDDKTTDN
ncbi:hypothetical protein [uncultured Alistipes sp.]|uniref:fimbrial tip adhesin FimD n=1 Tax=uncultured Alistipes sp. TaxID=538949 RepID=UPI003207DC07